MSGKGVAGDVEIATVELKEVASTDPSPQGKKVQ